jgi:uncharacterized protein (DUF1810 family)
MPPTPAPYNLHRFLEAQQPTYATARAELLAGQKRTHWMWFIFPQIQGLGSSPTAQRFAISSLAEAAAYLAHPILGPRLEECTAIVTNLQRSVDQIFGYPDDRKFHSSVTLFAKAAESHSLPTKVFHEALTRHFANLLDEATLRQLRTL